MMSQPQHYSVSSEEHAVTHDDYAEVSGLSGAPPINHAPNVIGSFSNVNGVGEG